MTDSERAGVDFEGASPAGKIALTVRFLIELGLLVAVAVLAWRVTPAGWNWLVAVVAVVVVAVVWGLFLSPKARFDVGGPGRIVLETALFAGTAVGLIAVGMIVPAVGGVVIWLVDRIALRLLR